MAANVLAINLTQEDREAIKREAAYEYAFYAFQFLLDPDPRQTRAVRIGGELCFTLDEISRELEFIEKRPRFECGRLEPVG